MKFKYNTRRPAIEYEKDIAAQWKKNKTFEKSVQQRPADRPFVFYDGPPFITGNPHHGTLLSSVVKDCIPRYQTMRGKRVERRWGWDCHGLPAENFVEQQLGITDRRDIGTKISLEQYITKARESMVANSELWESYIDRIGRWVDFRGAYRTMDKDFMESVWWAFKTLYDAGKIYEGEKVLMYDTKFATPVSKNEVTMDNDAYQTVTDPSVYVKFKMTDLSKLESALQKAWTVETASEKFKKEWNENNKTAGQCAITALLINDFFGGELRKVKVGEAAHIFNFINGSIVDLTAEQFGGVEINYDNFESRTREELLNGGNDTKNRYEVLKNNLPKDWCDETYFLAWTTTPWTLPANMALAVGANISYSEVKIGEESFIVAISRVDDVFKGHEVEIVRNDIKGNELAGLEYEGLFDGSGKVFVADFVEDAGGTGIVHIAPAYGEDDFELAKKENIPVKHAIDDNGYYLPEFAEKLHKIGVRDTDENGIEVWAANKFIAKCLEEQGIVWKIDYIQHEYPFNPRSKQRIMYRAIPSWFFDIQDQKPLMLEQNENIYWFPEHIKHGRFAKNIEQAPDWNLSRDRFWATAMPVWKGDKGTVKVVGSYDELYKLSGKRLDDYHRPWVDEITFDIDGEHFTRIDKVLDGWFESGSMPFAQLHYPFENKEKFEANYPADFISEYVAQVRAWFYYVHVVNTALFGKNAFKNCIVTGTIAGEDGRKMSKSLGNYTDPNELMDKFSADSLRFLLLSSPLLSGEDFALKDKEVGDIFRKLAMIWNMYDFFTMYAEVDGWEFDGEFADLKNLKNPLDIWIISRLHELKKDITNNMDAYNIPDAMNGILPFVDDASNWYVRRSRRRFWKSEDDDDKNDAYATLHCVLSKLAVLLAPFTPFLAEELWQKMVDGESVHLLDWPTNITVDQKVLDDMARAREIIEQGLALRMNQGDEFGQIKVRQPLSKLEYSGVKLDDFYEQIIADEVNVKAVIASAAKQSSGSEPGLPRQTSLPRNDDAVWLDKKITPELKREGQAREIIRVIQNARKDAGLNVDDRIVVYLTTNDQELQRAIDEHRETIATEILATNLACHSELAEESSHEQKDSSTPLRSAQNDNNSGFETVAKIDNIEIKVQLKKEET